MLVKPRNCIARAQKPRVRFCQLCFLRVIFLLRACASTVFDTQHYIFLGAVHMQHVSSVLFRT